MVDRINRRSNPPTINIQDVQLYKDIMIMREKFKLLAAKLFVSLAVEGPPGLGKTYTAEEIMHGGKNRLLPVASHAAQLTDVLYQTRGEQVVVLWDDKNYVFNSGPVMNLLNIAINPKIARLIPDNRKGGHGNFLVRSRHVFLTNKRLLSDPEFKDFDKSLRDQIEPLVSRFHLQHILPRDPLGCFHYACWLATDGAHLLRDLRTVRLDTSLSIEASNELLDFFAQNFARFKEVSPRSFMIMAEYRLKAPTMWESLCESLMNAEPRTETILRQKQPVEVPIKAPPAWTIRVVPVNERRVMGATLLPETLVMDGDDLPKVAPKKAATKKSAPKKAAAPKKAPAKKKASLRVVPQGSQGGQRKQGSQGNRR